MAYLYTQVRPTGPFAFPARLQSPAEAHHRRGSARPIASLLAERSRRRVAAARETGVDILWNGPPNERDFNGQLKIVDAMINRHVDAIALSPSDTNAFVGVVERAVREKIPVIIFDTGINTDVFTSRVATDNFGAGQMAARRMGQILGGKGKIVIVAVAPGIASTMAREQGFEEVIKKDFPGIEIVDKRYGWRISRNRWRWRRIC